MCVSLTKQVQEQQMEEKPEHLETSFAMFHLAYYLHLLQKKKKINMTNLKRRASNSKIIFYHNRTTSQRGRKKPKRMTKQVPKILA